MPLQTLSRPGSGSGAELSLLIWDLDGTLIDSRADLVSSVNATLAHLGRPPLAEAVVAGYVGDGAPALVGRALGLMPAPGAGMQAAPALAPEEAELARRGLEFFLAYYADHKLERTVLYPGVREGLMALAEAGYRMAVLTNKPVRPSREIVAALGVEGCFSAVFGGDSFARKKPDPIGIQALLEAAGLGPRAALMIGDSAIDVRAGRAAGVWTCGVRYGFMPASFAYDPPDWAVDSMAELVGPLVAERGAEREDGVAQWSGAAGEAAEEE